MTTNIQRASLVAGKVQLESVTLSSADLTTSLDPLDIPPELTVSLNYRASYVLPEEHPNNVFVRIEWEIEIRSEQGGDPVVRFSGAYLLVYRLEGAATYPEDALKYFAELNGPYNAWPYLRELVQTAASRTGLVGIVIPVFRPASREVEVPEEIEEKAVEA